MQTEHPRSFPSFDQRYREKLVGPRKTRGTPHGANSGVLVAGDARTGLRPCSPGRSPLEEPHNWIVSRSGLSGCAPRRRTRGSCVGNLSGRPKWRPHVTLTLLLRTERIRSLAALRTRIPPFGKTSGGDLGRPKPPHQQPSPHPPGKLLSS